MKNFKELRTQLNEKYKSKFPTSLVAAAVKIALDMGGNMTGAYKKIENMKRGLGDDPIVKDALKQANEEYKLREAKDLSYRYTFDNKGQANKFQSKVKGIQGLEIKSFDTKAGFVIVQVSSPDKKAFYKANEIALKLMNEGIEEGVISELNFSYAFFDKADLNKYMLKALKLKGLTVVDSEKQAGGHYVVRVKADDKAIIAKSNSLALQAMS